ncbi:MAG: hypothetical protein K2M31_03235 [Muribaculaceae bacterium]|nr:hypothetical protein [Muribaculaceae bacterium]
MKKSIFLLGALLLIFPLMTMPKKISLKLKTTALQSRPSRSQTGRKGSAVLPLEADSLQFTRLRDGVSFSGFDKPASSRRETFLITNSTDQYLKGVEVRIVYRDPEGRMLHSRDEEIMINIPPGETRQVTIQSFDTQQTYNYRLSTPPKRRAAQLFDVELSLLRILLPR